MRWTAPLLVALAACAAPVHEASTGWSPWVELEGRVVESNGDLLKISLGPRDRVRSGQELHLRRKGSYVGSLVLTDVRAEHAVGTFDTEFPGPGAPPRAGDVIYFHPSVR